MKNMSIEMQRNAGGGYLRKETKEKNKKVVDNIKVM